MPRWIASMTKAWRLPSRLSRMTARQMTRRRCLGAGRSGLWVRGGNGALDGAEKEFGEQGGDEIGQDPCSGQPWVLGWGMSHGEGRFECLEGQFDLPAEPIEQGELVDRPGGWGQIGDQHDHAGEGLGVLGRGRLVLGARAFDAVSYT